MDMQPNAEPESPSLGATATEEGKDQAPQQAGRRAAISYLS